MAHGNCNRFAASNAYKKTIKMVITYAVANWKLCTWYVQPFEPSACCSCWLEHDATHVLVNQFALIDNTFFANSILNCIYRESEYLWVKSRMTTWTEVHMMSAHSQNHFISDRNLLMYRIFIFWCANLSICLWLLIKYDTQKHFSTPAWYIGICMMT